MSEGVRCLECGRAAPSELFLCPFCGEPLPSDANALARGLAEEVGRALGAGYRVEEQIGQGGYALVFRVRDERLDRPLAAKVLLPELMAVRSIAERFRHEAQIAAKLNHPNIVPIYFVGGDDQAPCLVMPLIQGETLAARLKREKRLTWDALLGIARDVAAALDYAHKAGVVHRDVKPDNVLIDVEARRAMLADFGIAKALTAHGAFTGSGLALGTPHYVSPEQAEGERRLDGRSDVYSLGVVVYEMICGHPPFVGANAQAIFTQHVAMSVPSIRDNRPETTELLEAVVMRALAKEPVDRFGTAGEFVAALADALGDAPEVSTETVMALEGINESLFRALAPDTLEAVPDALLKADDVTSVAEAARAAEVHAIQCARVGDRDGLLATLRNLRARMDDPRPALKTPVQSVLARLAEDRTVVDGLGAWWRSGTPAVKEETEAHLRALMPEVGQVILELARRERSADLLVLVDRIGALNEAATQSLLQDRRAGVVAAIASALGRVTQPESNVERWLRAALAHANPDVRASALDAAMTRGGSTAERLGAAGLGDKEGYVRIAAIRALGASGRGSVVPSLTEALQSSPIEERAAAAEALARIGGAGAVRALMEVFDQRRMLRKERGPVQIAAARALATLPRELTKDALALLSRDTDPGVSSIAKDVLGQIQA